MPYVDRIPGGLADAGPPPGVDPRQVALGIRVEMEHTSDPRIAREIAYDHLTEDPRYYDKLAAIHQERHTGNAAMKKTITRAERRKINRLIAAAGRGERSAKKKLAKALGVSEAKVERAVKKGFEGAKAALLGDAAKAKGSAFEKRGLRPYDRPAVHIHKRSGAGRKALGKSGSVEWRQRASRMSHEERRFHEEHERLNRLTQQAWENELARDLKNFRKLNPDSFALKYDLHPDSVSDLVAELPRAGAVEMLTWWASSVRRIGNEDLTSREITAKLRSIEKKHGV